MAKRGRVINILHHSLSRYNTGAPNYNYEEGWHIRLAKEILKRSQDYEIKCWRPESLLKQIKVYQKADIPVKLFPSISINAPR